MNIASLGWGRGPRRRRSSRTPTPAFAPAASRSSTGAHTSSSPRRARCGPRSAAGFATPPTRPSDLPAVGDWVAYDCPDGAERASVQAILPRRSAFRRKQAGHETAEQVVAANVDVLFLVTSLNQDLNVRRIERYMTLAWESGADPVVVLTKADLCPDVEPALALVESVTFGVPVHVTSALTGAGLRRRPRPPRRRPHRRGRRIVGRRQVDPDQRPLRRGAARDPRDPRRRPRPPHHHPPRADRPARHGLRHRHAGDARAPALGLGRGPRAGVRGRRRRDRRVPVLGLRARARSRGAPCSRGARRRQASTPSASRATTKLQRELHYLEIRHDARARSEARKRWRAINKEARARARP